jgi:hypothetical protein
VPGANKACLLLLLLFFSLGHPCSVYTTDSCIHLPALLPLLLVLLGQHKVPVAAAAMA